MSATENFLLWAARHISGCYDCPMNTWCNRRFLGVTEEGHHERIPQECIQEITQILTIEIMQSLP